MVFFSVLAALLETPFPPFLGFHPVIILIIFVTRLEVATSQSTHRPSEGCIGSFDLILVNFN